MFLSVRTAPTIDPALVAPASIGMTYNPVDADTIRTHNVHRHVQITRRQCLPQIPGIHFRRQFV